MTIETSSSMSSRFPKLVGYRFHPTDEELISYYLKGKNSGRDHEVSNVPVIEVLKYDPWELPRQLRTESGDDEWYFFSKRDVRAVRRGKASSRFNRATKSGFWKPTGKDRNIKSKRDKKVIGTKKTLVFHRGKSLRSLRTTWVMHEYRAISDNSEVFVLYLLKYKSEETGDVSTPPAVEPVRSSASPVTSPSDAMSPNPAIPVMNVEPGNRPTASPFETEESFLDSDYEIQMQLESFGSEFTAAALDEMLPPMPQPFMIPNHRPSYPEIRYLNAFTRHHADTLYQCGSNEHDESISLLSADIPESSETDDEVTQSLLFESSTTFSSKFVAPQSASYTETILTKEIVGFETESSGDEDPESEIVMPEAVKKLSLQPMPEGTTRTRTSTSKGFFTLVENPRLKDGPSPPFVYVANILTATALLIVLVAEVLF